MDVTEKKERIALSVPIFTEYRGARLNRRVSIPGNKEYCLLVGLPIPDESNVQELYGITWDEFVKNAVKQVSYSRDKVALDGIKSFPLWESATEENLKDLGQEMTPGFQEAPKRVSSEKTAKNAIKEKKANEFDATCLTYGLDPKTATMADLIAAINRVKSKK